MATASSEFLNLCCRVCLFEDDKMISIHDAVPEFNQTLCQLLETCGDMKIEPSDVYSKLLCEDCVKDLVFVAKFREKCRTAVQTINKFKEAANKKKLKQKQQTEQLLLIPIKFESKEIVAHLTHPEEPPETIVKVEEKKLTDDEIPFEEVEYLDTSTLQSSKNNDCSTLSVADADENESISNVIEEEDMYDEIFNECEDDANDNVEVNYDDDVTTAEDDDQITVISMASNAITDNFIIDNVNFDGGVTDSNVGESAYGKFTKLKSYSDDVKVIINHTCDNCGAGFTHLNNLRKHLFTHKDMLHCERCVSFFRSNEEYRQHQSTCEELCEVSDNGSIKSFKKPLKRPPSTSASSSVNAKKKKPHQCGLCEKSFNSNSLLVTHERIHTGERPYKCDLCVKTFTTQGGLDLHTRRHTGVKPYVCMYCDQAFVESSNLKVHLRIHTGEKPHKCLICDRSFSRVFLLQIHQRTHTGERPYACKECNKAFAQQGDLAAHFRLHTGERPHQCPHCPKGFIKSSALTAHLRRHENERLNDNVTMENYKFSDEIVSTTTADEVSMIDGDGDDADQEANSDKDVTDDVIHSYELIDEEMSEA